MRLLANRENIPTINGDISSSYRGNVLRAGCKSLPAVKNRSLFKPASARFGGVSRFGVNPKPTVIVRMEENRIKGGQAMQVCACL
jgi:hypothetical protein